MSSKITELAAEIANARDIELPRKLAKIKDLILSNDNPKKLKFDLYKYNILETISVSLKQEFGFISDGWNLATDLVKTFRLCTTDFSSNDKEYQNIFLPQACENVLILAKKIQDKYVKTKAFSDEFLIYFRSIINDYTKIISNNTHLSLKCLKSQRLFQLLLNDEQNTSVCVMNAYKDIFKIKRNLLSQFDEKSLNLLLDEIIYKMATSELVEVGLAIFQLLNAMCNMDPNLIKNLIRRYKGIKLLTNKWKGKNIENDLNEFINHWEVNYKTRVTDQELHDKAIIIQKTWRGFQERKTLKKADRAFAKFHRQIRKKKEKIEDSKQKKLVEEELKFQLLLDHRRKQRQRKIEMAQLIEIIPSNQIEKYFEKQREYSATLIQARYRGYRQRKIMPEIRDKMQKFRAAVCIQRAVRRWLQRLKNKRNRSAFYSRPAGLDGIKRETLFDKIRQHLDSLPPNPRSEKSANELHDKAQRAFHNYVLSQRSMREQCQNLQVLLAINNNDADLILNAPKLSQVNEEEINLFSHNSKPVTLAAKEAHKRMLRKMRSKWYEILNDDSDSDDDPYDEAFDELNNNIRNLNFNSSTNNLYADIDKKGLNINRKIINDVDSFQLHQGITKKEKIQLKTYSLRQSLTKMMMSEPDKSRIWNVSPFDDKNFGKIINKP